MRSPIKTNDGMSEAIRQIQTVYGKTAFEYDGLFSTSQVYVTYPILIKELIRFCGSLDHKIIVDMGCGGGRFMNVLDSYNAYTVGIDITKEFLDMAVARGCKVILASMHNIPLKEESIDIIVSNFVLNYFPPYGQLLSLKDKFRILKPGGLLIFSYMHPFSMRLKYNDNYVNFSSPPLNYFNPNRTRKINLFGEIFNLYLLDWPEIINLVLESGFAVKRVVDAERITSDQISEKIIDVKVKEFISSLHDQPYGIFIIAQKPWNLD